MEQEKLKFIQEWLEDEYSIFDMITEFTKVEDIIEGDYKLLDFLIEDLEEEYDCEIDYDLFQNAETFGDLSKLIK